MEAACGLVLAALRDPAGRRALADADPFRTRGLLNPKRNGATIIRNAIRWVARFFESHDADIVVQTLDRLSRADTGPDPLGDIAFQKIMKRAQWEKEEILACADARRWVPVKSDHVKSGCSMVFIALIGAPVAASWFLV